MSAATTFVIPTWNSIAFLPRCIAAIRDHEPDSAIVVVDNASEDDTVAWLETHASTVHVVRNATNVGFGAASNQGVAAATTPWVCLLNADAFITPGCLAALHNRLDRTPETGIAVPMFLNEDGTLQEAGAMLSRDGRGALYGNGTDPGAWQYTFPRVVDYGSAACWLVRRDTFLELGGFDVETYGLAYYEDVDFCLRAAAHGIRTAYEPGARVTHIRNASQPAAAVAALRDRNQTRFVERWRALLDRRPSLDDLDTNPQRFVAARDADRFERLLVLVRDLPEMSDPWFAAVHDVQRAWPNARVTIVADCPPDPSVVVAWQSIGIEVAAGHDDWWGWFRDRLAFYTTIVALGTDVQTHFAALLARTQVACPHLVIPVELLARAFRPFHRPTHSRYLDETTSGGWTSVDPLTPLPDLLQHAGWTDPERAPERV